MFHHKNLPHFNDIFLFHVFSTKRMFFKKNFSITNKEWGNFHCQSGGTSNLLKGALFLDFHKTWGHVPTPSISASDLNINCISFFFLFLFLSLILKHKLNYLISGGLFLVFTICCGFSCRIRNKTKTDTFSTRLGNIQTFLFFTKYTTRYIF